MPLTLRERYCLAHRCDLSAFESRLFWRCLYPQAYPLACLFLGGRFTRYFAADLELLGSLAPMRRRAELNDELAYYHRRPENDRWIRGVLNLRLSTQRLIAAVGPHLEAVVPRPPSGRSTGSAAIPSPATVDTRVSPLLELQR